MTALIGSDIFVRYVCQFYAVEIRMLMHEINEHMVIYHACEVACATSEVIWLTSKGRRSTGRNWPTTNRKLSKQGVDSGLECKYQETDGVGISVP